jgi:L-glutamine-phosphate cytidylyltransferase
MKAVILAAGMGSRLAPLTNDRPKPMVEVGGRPLLLRALDRLADAGIDRRDVLIVGGYREDVLRACLAREAHPATVVTNPRYDTWNSWYSLVVARSLLLDKAFLVLEGDVLFDEAVLPKMLAADGPALLAVDFRADLDDETMKVVTDGAARPRVRALSKQLDRREAAGEYIGITRIDASVTGNLFDDLARFEAENITHEYYDHSFHRLASRGEVPFFTCDVSDCVTMEIDDVRDLARAEGLLAVHRRAG